MAFNVSVKYHEKQNKVEDTESRHTEQHINNVPEDAVLLHFCTEYFRRLRLGDRPRAGYWCLGSSGVRVS